MIRKLKYGLYSVLLCLTITISSVVGIFAAFNSNAGSGGIHITYEVIHIPVNITKDTISGIVTPSRDTVISWDETEQAAKMIARDLNGTDIFQDEEYLIFDVGGFIKFGTNYVDSSLYKVIVFNCKWTSGCTYNETSTVYPLMDVYDNNPKTGFHKSITIPNDGKYHNIIVDFTNFTASWQNNVYNYEGANLTGFRLDYFDLRDSVDYAEQGLLVKSVVMCQTLAAAERLYGEGSNIF